jgi:hypothetical protein
VSLSKITVVIDDGQSEVPAKCYRWRDAEDTDIFYALTISFIQVHIHFPHIGKMQLFVAGKLAPALGRSWRSLRSFDCDSTVWDKIAASLHSTAPTGPRK